MQQDEPEPQQQAQPRAIRIPRWAARTIWPNHLWEVRSLRTRAQKRNHITNKLDDNGYDWLVVLVAGSGFFTDSFNLFSVNVTLPILAHLYWQNDTSERTETLIDCLTLAGSMVGQVLFGILADVRGRQRLYGVELVVVLVATVGIVESGQGIDKWMSIQAQICFWRFVMGIGIGAEYPLSAVITAEWAATDSRARMLASVFFAQPLGQMFAALVGLSAILGHGDSSNASLDKVWRIVSSVGGIPAIIAIVFRFTITDPGRWTLDVRDDGIQALLDTNKHVRSSASSSQEVPPLPEQFTRRGLWNYFIVEGNWRYLMGTSICWFLLDVTFFGLGMNNPKTLASIWESNIDSSNIRSLLISNVKQSLITVSIGSILGTLALIVVINKISRRKLLIYSFLALAGLFCLTGTSFEAARHHPAHILTIVLCGICEFVFNFGPNTLTFIIPAEIFPTRYRGTRHGIAAASGKLGSIVIQLVLFGAQHWIIGENKRGLGYLLFVFAAIMASGALFAWAWLPEIQSETKDENDRRVLKPRKLEELAEGLSSARRRGEVIRMRRIIGR
ncbi:MFS general substrate transporter [Rhizodiscina lignyota]|uniref:MFS general substrate transporter n=1 Tax=Rhizodiscina lignyota TaxID=1504668 RepID=A0A9P4ISI3_9PEZI|nr:MFS general substrate transporter [Rhizodiscina lignyota]